MAALVSERFADTGRFKVIYILCRVSYIKRLSKRNIWTVFVNGFWAQYGKEMAVISIIL